MLSIDEQKSLIEKYVKIDSKFKGNEDLFEDFCRESLQKTYMVFNIENNIEKIESYVSKVVHTSILSVLKNSGRAIVNKKASVPIEEEKNSNASKPASQSSTNIVKEDIQEIRNYESFIFGLPDPKETAEEVLITKDCLDRVASSVCVIHKEVPHKQFLDIFYLRYVKGCKQSDIGKKLNLSQSEVSKRLMHLSRLISNIFDVAKS